MFHGLPMKPAGERIKVNRWQEFLLCTLVVDYSPISILRMYARRPSPIVRTHLADACVGKTKYEEQDMAQIPTSHQRLPNQQMLPIVRKCNFLLSG